MFEPEADYLKTLKNCPQKAGLTVNEQNHNLFHNNLVLIDFLCYQNFFIVVIHTHLSGH